MQQLIVGLLLCCFFTQSGIFLISKSATFDEVQYFGIGKYLLTEHKWDVMGAILHPPLPYYLNSIPLLFSNQPQHVWEYDPATTRDRAFLGSVDYYRGQELLSDRSNVNDRLLITSRVVTALLGVLLGFYIYRFSSLLYGGAAGILSTALYAFNPIMIAFSGLIVPDMPLTTFGFIALYYTWLDVKSNSIRSAVYSGGFLGLALLSKFTAVLLLPLVVSTYVICLFKQKRKLFFRIMLVFVLAAGLVVLGYGFDPAPYIEGILFQIEKNRTGQAAFLMGHYSDHGWWYFYPVVFLLKTPLAITILFASTIVVQVIRKRSVPFEVRFLLAPVILTVFFFVIWGGAIGIRYLLPIYPFIFVAIGYLYTEQTFIRRCSYCLALWAVVSAISVAPHYLSYFNELTGGPSNGYKYLVDSNLDWGQDLPSLKRFMDSNKIDRISLSYFGADSPQRYGINYDWLPSYYLFNPEPEKAWSIKPGQLVAISVTNLQGVYLDRSDQFKWLKEQKPVAQIGHSIFVYDLKQ